MRDAWRLALGTLTVLPTAPPTSVDRATARGAMLLAPVAVVPLGVLVALVVWGGGRIGVAPLVVGFAAVGALALGSRALHLDGLSDVVDGLTASYDARRSLEVMRSGTSGPAGTVALVVVLGAQAAAFAALVRAEHGWLSAGVVVCLSRAALLLTCVAGVPGARSDGLGSAYAGSVPALAALAGWVVVALASTALADPWWHGVLTAVVALGVVLALVRRATTRFGGVTGDVFGAAIELCLLVLVAGAAW